ncbi:MAG TPA: FAD-dependent oxidoreductase [Vicinamibacteria bacterium]|nr:FAD-dependent oxidoreductase [Vicinamibacteria bacterium]
MSRRHTAADVVVLGSGLTACLVALELARAGKRTVVVGASEEPAPGHVPSGPPLAYVDAVRRWGRAGAGELWELQRSAHTVLRAEWGQACDMGRAGGFTLATSRTEGLALAESEDLLRDDGFAGEFLDGFLLEARFAVRGFAAAYWAEDEAELDAVALAGAARAAALAAGAVLLDAAGAGLADVSPSGVRAPTAEGDVSAPVAVLATAEAARLSPDLAGSFAWRESRGVELPARDGAPVPSPARACGGGARWTSAAGPLLLEVTGGDPAAFAAEHLPQRAGPQGRGWSRRLGLSCDGLPWIGPLPGRPLFAALAGAADLAYEPLLSRWAVSELLTGRDATPARLRAARAASAML